ncbi:MAG TPA: choice-of-anchor tandem repeat GloVer-containing protein, partial [Terriglobia bacterium]|nr:choice-of-anchor tandem repeat GloVer-containing protein [Terriglobia bacterium]
MLKKMLLCCFFPSFALATTATAQTTTAAPTYTVLYSFCALQACADGETPAGVLIDSTGNIYGVAGDVIFELDSAGNESVLYNTCSSGYCLVLSPGLVRDATGAFYGTTATYVPPVNGGSFYGTGSVFEYSTIGVFTELYSFAHQAPSSDGSDPNAGLVMDSAANLYGTTMQGGTHGFGTAFRVDSDGNEAVLYNFDSVGYGLDGITPQAPLFRDAAGNLYGTTTEGGASMTLLGTDGNGTLFKLDPSGNETVLYSFCTQKYCSDGSTPQG